MEQEEYDRANDVVVADRLEVEEIRTDREKEPDAAAAENLLSSSGSFEETNHPWLIAVAEQQQ